MTWNDIAVLYPDFVQWVVQTGGPLPDGEVDPEDYERLAAQFRRHGE